MADDWFLSMIRATDQGLANKRYRAGWERAFGRPPLEDVAAQMQQLREECPITEALNEIDNLLAEASGEYSTEDQLNHVRWLLYDMVVQHCTRGSDLHNFDANFLSANAAAIRYLCKVGMLEMVNDGYGRCVQAKDKGR